ncbi:MAG: hypothetical protein KGJ78_04525 [Alphaproteobacteria bacterium]|nr:hypothetical protein [Alphaproteobacteria bacterium]
MITALGRHGDQVRSSRRALAHDLLHGLTPEEFNKQAKELAEMEAMTPAMRARLKAQLIERLKTPVDEPSWGPDWVRKGERVAAKKARTKKQGGFARFFGLSKRDDKEKDKEDEAPAPAMSAAEMDDASIISRNMEKSRQVAHYKPLYIAAAVLALAILSTAMFVDYHIIREVWTRALSNEFMVVPPALQSSVIFKSLQVVFAVLIVHFMLKATGVYGRTTMIVAAFVLALVMIGGLGYLVAYNNMSGATSATLEQRSPSQDSIDRLFTDSGVQHAAMTQPAATATQPGADDGVSLGLPKLSKSSLAAADSWFWLAFASVVFFIVTTVAALYMQIFENNVRNTHIANDYKHRQKQFAQLHLVELADRNA